MLPLTFSSYFLVGYQIVSQIARRHRYERVLQSLLPTASIAIYRRPTSLRAQPLDSGQVPASCVEFEDNFIQLYKMHSTEEVNLGSWTCYSPRPTTVQESPDEEDCCSIYVVVETEHLQDENAHTVCPDQRVHVLALGRPVAWKSKDNFDVIVSCGLPELVQMVDAYGQDRLYVEEDTQIKRLATIQLNGCPRTLYQCEGTASQNSQKTSETLGTSNVDKVMQQSSLSQNSSISPMEAKSTSFPQSSEANSSPKAKLAYQKDKKKNRTKPPNVLIYCGAESDSARLYASVKSSLELCINTDVYIIYHLTHVEMLSSPWIENTTLLLLSSCTKLVPEAEQKIKDFVSNHNGWLLSFNTSAESLFAKRVLDPSADAAQLFTFMFDHSTVTALKGSYYFSDIHGDSEAIVSVPGDQRDQALIVKTTLDNGSVVVLSQLVLEKDSSLSAVDQRAFIALKSSNTGRLLVLKHVLATMGMDVSPRSTPDLTPCCLLSRKQDTRKKFLSSVHRKVDKNGILGSRQMSLMFLETMNPSKPAAANLLPVVTGSTAGDSELLESFDEQGYWSNLDTTNLGQIVLYTDVISSTMHVFDGMLFSLPRELGPVAIAGRQTSGKGRGGNVWLSPKGCAMFTFPLSFEVNSEMGQKISFLQHLVSTAVVHGIKSMPTYQNLNLRLKWPNDVYYGRDMKLGGVIVTSTVMGSTIYSTIGCGVNVGNSDPTICINDIIQLSNRSRGSHGGAGPTPLLTAGSVIARTLSTLEKLLADFEKFGHKQFCEVYYKYWLHGGAKVSLNLETDGGSGEGEIVGLDEFGFLCVRKTSGEILSVQPDGNSFDMTQNLVYCKRRL